MMTIACNSHHSNHLFNEPFSLLCHHEVDNVDHRMEVGEAGEQEDGRNMRNWLRAIDKFRIVSSRSPAAFGSTNSARSQSTGLWDSILETLLTIRSVSQLLLLFPIRKRVPQKPTDLFQTRLV
jgi:hypothetical protein